MIKMDESGLQKNCLEAQKEVEVIYYKAIIKH